MAICPVCKFENRDADKFCKNCRRAMPVAAPAPIPKETELLVEPSPPVPTVAPDRLPVLLNRHVGADDATTNLLSEVVPNAEVVARRPTIPETERLRAQLELALERQIGTGEPLTALVAELIGKSRSEQAQRSSIESGAAPADSLPREIHAVIEGVLGRKTQTGEQAVDIVRELAVKAPPDHIKVPSKVAKVLNYLPVNLRWIAAVAAPLLVGGGSGYLISPSYQKQLAQTQGKLVAAEEQSNNLKIKQDQQETEVDLLKEENQRLLSNLTSDVAGLNVELQSSKREVKTLQQSTEDARAKANLLSSFARYGYVEWHGVGGGALSFSPKEPSRGRVTDGIFPSRNCKIVEIISSDADKPQLLNGSDCFGQAIKIKGSDNKDKKVLIVWRQTSGN